MALPTVAQNAPYTWVIMADANGINIAANPNGQAIMQNSAPVVIASDQTPVAVKGATTGNAVPAQAFYMALQNFAGQLQGLQSAGLLGLSGIDPNLLLGFMQYGMGSGVGSSTATRIRVADLQKPFNAQALTASSANTPTSIWTPAAGKKFRLMGYFFSLSAAAGLVFHDLATVGGGGVIPLPSPIAAIAGIVQTPPIGNGYLSTTINNQLWIDATAAATVTGFVWGTEE